jgi:K+-transporting ATPase ATPase C chain
MVKQLRPAFVSLVLLTVITGLFYPLAVTVFAQVVFPTQANGSLIRSGDKVVGSSLIGQPFSDPKYFWGRLSATSSFPYNAAASSGSNYGPLNNNLMAAVQARIDVLRAADPDNTLPIPVDLVTASASGLDPQISPAAAEYQISRVAKARGLDEVKVRDLIAQYTEGRILGLIGEPRVDVLRLNLALDGITP